jgi:nucleotide-binding universal stress UspA family protein
VGRGRASPAPPGRPSARRIGARGGGLPDRLRARAAQILSGLGFSSRASSPSREGTSENFGSELILVHVEELAAVDPLVAVAEEHRRTVRLLERAKRALEDQGARTVVRAGFAATETLEAIRETSPDLVLMTTHGRTGAARAAFGSVTEAVLRRAPCPVLVIRSVPALAAKRHEVRTNA